MSRCFTSQPLLCVPAGSVIMPEQARRSLTDIDCRSNTRIVECVLQHDSKASLRDLHGLKRLSPFRCATSTNLHVVRQRARHNRKLFWILLDYQHQATRRLNLSLSALLHYERHISSSILSQFEAATFKGRYLMPYFDHWTSGSAHTHDQEVKSTVPKNLTILSANSAV